MISENKVYSYFDDHHGPLTPSTRGWYDGVCPYCGSRKLAVHPEIKQVKCWKGCIPKMYVVNFVKNYFGVLYIDAVEILEDYSEKLRLVPVRENAPKKDISILPEGYHPIIGDKTIMGDRARNALLARGFDLNYLDMLGVGYVDKPGDFFGYIIIPFRKEGTIRYFIGRDFIGGFPRYKNPPVEDYGVGKSELFFNEEALSLYDKIYLLEGWADAATIGPEAMSTQGTVLSDIQASYILSSSVKEVVVVPDGFYYNAGLDNASKLIGQKRVKVLNLDPYSTEDCKDVNSLGLDLILSIEKSTEYMNNLSDFYVTARSFSTSAKNFLI